MLKSLVVMHRFRAVWMIPLCHILIQKKIIIVSSVTEILHINVIQFQSILMKHFSSYLRMTILINSILNLDMASLHLGNQFMNHMTMSGNC